MIVFAALPILTLLCLWVAFVAARGWREALLDAAVVWGVLVAVSVEGLSVFAQLRFVPLILFWAVATIVAAAAAYRYRPKAWRMDHITPGLVAAGLPLGLVLASTLLVAVVAPPNTWDSMTYHMARVAHWAFQGSVAAYPTETVRQLYLPPWAEFAIATFQVLSGGDHFASLIQWFSMAASLVGVSLIARELGAVSRGQYLAAVIAATLPMGIMQASSTQNDYAEALWLVCAVFYATQLRFSATWPVLALGASLGLAVLTKGSSYVFGLPLVAFAGWWFVMHQRLGAWRPVLAVAFLVVALNAGAWIRNIAVFASPLGPDQQVTNHVLSLPALISNLVRDAAAQVGTPSRTANAALTDAVTALHRAIGIGPSDPRTTWPGADFQVNLLRPEEDTTPDPLQFLLLLGAAIVCLLNWRRMRLPALYLGGLVSGFVVFALVLRWQPWHSRLELPLMVLAAPLAATVLAQRWPHPALTSAITAVLVLASLPWLLGPSIRPLGGAHSILASSRSDVYFYARPELEASYLHAADQAHATGCHVIGIDGGEDTWEYPLWVYLGDGYRVVPVHPAAATAGLKPPAAAPCEVFGAP